MFKRSDDPALQAAIVVLGAMVAIALFSMAAIVVIPVALAFGGYKLYQHLKPLPVYIPEPEPEPPPFELTDKHLREHVAIFAPSGWGKTQFLETHILQLMHRPNPPALFVIDSQGNKESPESNEQPMLYKLERLQLLLDRPLHKIYVIDPSDKPALNFFGFGDPTSPEVTDLFGYLFSSLELDISGTQANVVRWLMRLMSVIENPTIATLLEAVESEKPHPAVAHLDEIGQNFFYNQFYKKGSMQLTKNAVAQRCYAILGNPLLAAMFSAPENRFSAAEAMRDGAWCFISTHGLGENTSSLLGRFFISQILSACYELGMTHRLRAVLVLDEAFEYFDKKTERILSQARKYGLGLTFATQHLGQMDGSLRKAVFGNTSVKVAGRLGTDDAKDLAKEMEIPPEVVRGLTQFRGGTNFAVAANGLKPTILSVEYGLLDRMPRMSEAEHQAFRQLNRERLTATEQQEPPAADDEPVDEAPPQSDIEAVIVTARRLEKLLVDRYAASGPSLHKKITSVEGQLPPHVVQAARYVATIRNNVAHVDGFTIPDHERFFRCAEEVEVHITATTNRTRSTPTPSGTASRPAAQSDPLAPDTEY